MVVIIIAIICLVVLSAFFSSCENAYSSVSRVKLMNKAEEGSKNALQAINIIDNYSTTLSTILIGNNLVNILISSLGTIIAVDVFGESSGPIYATIIITILLLILGEILPKTLGNKFNFTLSLAYTKIFIFFKYLFYPITWIVNKMIAGTVEATREKHIPVYEVEGNKVIVNVGSIEHPMLEEHFIEWVTLETKQGVQRKQLKPGEAPKVTFVLSEGEEVEAVYAYCNLHGLWKAN